MPKFTIQDVLKRFKENPQLVEFLPMLNEYIFTDSRIDWMCTASIKDVVDYCIAVDE